MSYSNRRSTGHKGVTTSCSDTEITAAIGLHLNTHAAPSASSVFNPKSGVNPTNMPIATPPAIAWGVSFNENNFTTIPRKYSYNFLISPLHKSKHLPLPD